MQSVTTTSIAPVRLDTVDGTESAVTTAVAALESSTESLVLETGLIPWCF